MNPNRRHFLNRGLLGLGLGGPAISPPGLSSAEAAADKPGLFTEPARELPLVEDCDVIVCGAGPAGIAAALTAARCGARVRLFEWRGCLGGVWTAGLLGYLLDFDKPGLNQEIMRELSARGLRRGESRSSVLYDPEGMKLMLEDMLGKAGVKFQLHTRVAAAHREGRRLRTLITESKSGRQAWRAAAIVDCTGDGDVGALAGCSFEYGQGDACPCQPMSLNALMVCRDAAALQPFLHGADPSKADGRAKDALLAEIKRSGHFPSYSKPTLWALRDNLLLMMSNHQYGTPCFDAEKITAATVQARAEMHRIVNGLRKLGGPWEGLQIAATAEQIGVRDGRRIAGRARVVAEDVAKGNRQEDAVVRATFSVDIHALSAEANHKAAYSNAGIKTKPYDIALRSLLARDVDGLMMAGRCISGDFIAHASYRVTGNAVAMGEAAGVTSALAAEQRALPHEIPWPKSLEKLKAIGQRA